MKNIGFHFVAISLLVILVTTAGGATLDFEKLTLFSVLSAAVAVVAGYFALGAGLAELYKRFTSGIGHDLLYAILNHYFPLHRPIVNVANEEIVNLCTQMRNFGIREYCMKGGEGEKKFQIKEITDIPFTCYDHNDKLRKTSKNLVQTICDFHFPNGNMGVANTSFIVGNAGAGKSFAVKRVALSLLELANAQKDQIIVPLPIPVATWQKDNEINGWIVNMVNTLFLKGTNLNKNKEIISELIKDTSGQYKIIYLFDGLDEIRNEDIETFFTQVYKIIGEKSIIFGTREEVFEQFKKRNLLSYFQRFKLEELSDEEIKSIIEDNIKPEHQKHVLDKRDNYTKFKSPLLLGVLAKVVNDDSTPLDPIKLNNDPLTYIWKKFLGIVYKEKSADVNDRFTFPEGKILRYAHFLAKREDDGFSLDELQPEVLIDTSSKLFYAVFTRLLIGIIISSGIGFTMSGPLDFIPAGLLGGLISTVAFLLPVEQWLFEDPKNKNFSNKTGFKIMLSTLVYLFVSLFLFGIFFSITGQRRDMIELIAPADWIIGILFAVMFTILAGLHDLQYSFQDDIQLIQKKSIFHHKALDFPKALSFTLAFGFIVALVCSGLAVLYSRYFPSNIFTGWMKENSLDWGMTIFFMVFCIILPIASSIGFLIGLNNPESYKVKKEQLDDLLPYFSITNTIYNSIILSFLVMLIFAGAWSLFNMLLFKTKWEGGNKGIESGFAAAIFIGIWWGWKDIIKTWVLRLTLFLKGEAAISFPKMIKDFERVSIIIRTGARYRFLDPSLDAYLADAKNFKEAKNSKEADNPKETDNPKEVDNFTIEPYQKVKWILPSLILVVFLIVIVRINWREKFYWHEPTTGLELTNYTKAAKKISDNQVKVLKSGKLIIQSRGLVRVGRILGQVTPGGTSTGFFGMPLKTSFNILPEGKHGALMYRLGAQGSWKTVYNNPKVQFMDTYRFLKTYETTLSVKKNDTLEFAINDTEWQNNFKEFHLRVYSSTRKKKSKK